MSTGDEYYNKRLRKGSTYDAWGGVYYYKVSRERWIQFCMWVGAGRQWLNTGRVRDAAAADAARATPLPIVFVGSRKCDSAP